MAGEMYDMLPHEEVVFLRHELKRLSDRHEIEYQEYSRDPHANQNSLMKLPPDPAILDIAHSRELISGMARLGDAIDALLRMVVEAKAALENSPKDSSPKNGAQQQPVSETARPKLYTDPKIHDRLEDLMSQNEKIASGILALANIVRDAFASLEPYKDIAQRLDKLTLLSQDQVAQESQAISGQQSLLTNQRILMGIQQSLAQTQQTLTKSIEDINARLARIEQGITASPQQEMAPQIQTNMPINTQPQMQARPRPRTAQMTTRQAQQARIMPQPEHQISERRMFDSAQLSSGRGGLTDEQELQVLERNNVINTPNMPLSDFDPVPQTSFIIDSANIDDPPAPPHKGRSPLSRATDALRHVGTHSVPPPP